MVPRGHILLRQGAQASKQVLFAVSRGCVELTWQQQLGVSSRGVQVSKGSPEVKMGILAEGQMFGSNISGVEPFTAIAGSEGCEVLQVLGRDIQRLPSLVQERIRNQLNSAAEFHLQYARKTLKRASGATQMPIVDSENSKPVQQLDGAGDFGDALHEVDALDGMVVDNVARSTPLWLLKSPFLSTKSDFDYEMVTSLQETFPYYKPSFCKRFPKLSSHEVNSTKSDGSQTPMKEESCSIAIAEPCRGVDPLVEEFQKARQRREERALPAASGRLKAEQELQQQIPMRTVCSAPSSSSSKFAGQRPRSQAFKPHPKGLALPRYHLLKQSNSSPALGPKSSVMLGSSQLRDISQQHANSSSRLLTPLLEGLQLGVRQTHGEPFKK